MADHQLYITLDNDTVSITNSDGSSADSIDVDANDTVTFYCHDHAWGIQFIGEGTPGNSDRQTPPVSPLSFAGKKGNDGGVFTVGERVNPGDRWDYVAAVHHDDRVYTRDPDIVIKSRGGG